MCAGEYSLKYLNLVDFLFWIFCGKEILVNVLSGLARSGRRLLGNQMIINVTVVGEGRRARAI